MPTPYPSAGRKGHRYRTARQQVINEETHCVRCRRPVDKRLPGTHPDGPSADHWPIPLQQLITMGVDPNDRATMRLAHLGCNSGACNRGANHPGRRPGARSRGGYKRVHPRVVAVSREW